MGRCNCQVAPALVFIEPSSCSATVSRLDWNRHRAVYFKTEARNCLDNIWWFLDGSKLV